LPYLRQNLLFTVLDPNSRHPKKKFDEIEGNSRIQIEIIKKILRGQLPKVDTMAFDPSGFTGKRVSLPLERRNVRLGNGNDGSCSYLL